MFETGAGKKNKVNLQLLSLTDVRLFLTISDIWYSYRALSNVCGDDDFPETYWRCEENTLLFLFCYGRV